MRALIGDGLVTAVHDVSDGGLLVALAEMAMASHIGAVLEAPSGSPRHAFWFGEDQARYVVTAKDADAIAAAGEGGGGAARRGSAPPAAACSRSPTSGRFRSSDLLSRFEPWLPAYMAGTT